jgi:RND superfamily putative drug exporter
VLLVSVLGLGVLAAFAPTFDARGISFTDAIRGGSEATVGQMALARHFAAGSASPAVVLAPEDDWRQVAAAAADVAGVASVAPFTGQRGGPPSPDAAPAVVDLLEKLGVLRQEVTR